MANVTGQDQGRAPEATLVLIDDGDRLLDSAPADVGIGIVRLSGWQVHQIESPASFDGQDSYLIKLNYELALEPEVPPPPWFEVGFELSDLRTKEPVAVLDALPRAVFEPSGPAAYGVSGYLSFTPLPRAVSAAVDLPALRPFIDVFGVGGHEVRWRYMAPGISSGIRGVRPGSYVSWIILVVPAGCAELDVQLTVRYDLDPDDALGCLPGSRPGGFRLALAQRAEGLPDFRPAAPAAEDEASHPGTLDASGQPARVFISYAHDDDRHVESVRAFAEFLAAGCGLDVHLDRWDLHKRRDWYQWAGEQVRQADYVIVVASPMCRRVGDGEIENTRHRGLQSELALLRELLHSDRSHWTPKLLPVVLPGGSASDIPLFLQPQTADHYLVEDLTVRGAEDLIRVIIGRPPFQRPATSESAALPSRLRAL
jgi:hypothetical protein